jgi:serine O-acetyltransferase
MSAWRSDLSACGRRGSWWGAVAGWFANPGFALACHYRLGHWALAGGRCGRGIARLIERRMIMRFACDISAQARIGRGIRFPHPLAIVIGEGVVIGDGVTIYHGVTLGRRRPDLADYPTIGDGATIFCGATLIGAVTVEEDGVIGAARLILAGEGGARQARSQGRRRPGERSAA